MVEKQLDYIRENPSSTRHQNRKQRNTVRVDPTEPLRGRELVVVFGEANAWPLCDPLRPQPDDPELVQLVAERISTGERFERLLRPVRPLGPRVPLHLDLSADEISRADEPATVIAAWKEFIKPGDLQLGWGSYCRDLLAREGAPPEAFLNLRSVLARLVDGAPGSVENLAESFGASLPVGRGRATRRLDSLAFMTRATLEGRVVPPRLKSHR